MDRVYRGQRHIYDLTRKYYLLGRDALIQRMEVHEGDRVLEIGCGTARNLIQLARRSPSIKLYGIDASAEMLKTAQRNLSRAGLAHRVTLAHCLAEELSAETSFGLTEPFDTVFFSYSLSMIPEWQAAVDQGLRNLRANGSLWVVDFWDQQSLPTCFATLLRKWLSLFHVHHRPELLTYFQELESSAAVKLYIEPLYRRYAYMARLTKIT
jgi:S-adenosylmethionine-diacylgycerolhomoserine-N-methlytransferase